MRPKREAIRTNEYAYFVSTQTKDRKPFFRHERWARLMVSTIHHYAEEHFLLHAFVVMPDHLHLLLTPNATVEKAVQLIKGGFSFRAKRELEWKFDIWQQGFTDHRIRDEEDWKRHLEYIRSNPIEAHLVVDSVLYEFMGAPNAAFPQGLKPLTSDGQNVRAEARTLQTVQGPNIDVGQPAKETGFSSSVGTPPKARALAPEGGDAMIETPFFSIALRWLPILVDGKPFTWHREPPASENHRKLIRGSRAWREILEILSPLAPKRREELLRSLIATLREEK